MLFWFWRPLATRYVSFSYVIWTCFGDWARLVEWTRFLSPTDSFTYLRLRLSSTLNVVFWPLHVFLCYSIWLLFNCGLPNIIFLLLSVINKRQSYWQSIRNLTHTTTQLACTILCGMFFRITKRHADDISSHLVFFFSISTLYF